MEQAPAHNLTRLARPGTSWPGTHPDPTSPFFVRKVSTMVRKPFRPVVALAAAAALGVVGLWVPASAAPSNIDPDALGSVTIHKYQMPDGGQSAPNIGALAVETPDDWVALGGVTFSISQVLDYEGQEVDLSTSQGWDAIDDITVAKVLATSELLPLDSGETSKVAGADFGTLVFSDLPVGLYLVQEDGIVGAEGPDGQHIDVTDSTLPFLAAIPTPGENPGEWTYDLHAYPKNSTGTAIKSCSTEGAHAVGDSMMWTIVGNIPRLAEDDVFTHYLVSDTLPPQVSLNDHTLTVTSGTAEPVEMVIDQDYSFEVSDAVGEDGEKVTLTFLPPGLAKLDGAQLGQVALTLDTRIDRNSDDGSIVNGEDTFDSKAYVEINRAHIPVTAQCDLGGLRVVKHIEGQREDILDGAQFQLFTSVSDAETKTNPVVFDGEDTFVSGAYPQEGGLRGAITLDGIVPGTYWLVETQAPAGYIGYGEPIEVEIVAGGITEMPITYVSNTQKPSPPLGKLGAVATPVLVTVGALLVGGALTLGLVRRRNHA